MLSGKVEFEGLTGVGSVRLDLVPDQHVYTFIGANGVGKTKTLEALFQVMFLSNESVTSSLSDILTWTSLKFSSFSSDGRKIDDSAKNKNGDISLADIKRYTYSFSHPRPVVYIGAQSRGAVKYNSSVVESIGSFEYRRKTYFESVFGKMKDDFGSLNMGSGIEAWFVALARSSNPYQKKEDNREIEIKTVIKLLHAIDSRIDPEFLEISGDNRVSLRVEGQKRELSQLSSGFTSILKLIQAIVSGYGYFTNETNLQHVKGVVLIDEIESHLHLTWQANIIPLLKKLFPNTTFYITTHSSIVLSQLHEGEAYKLERDSDGIVKSQIIEAPNKAALIDIMNDVFNVDLNQMKLDNSSADDQKEAKASLLQLLKQQGAEK
ncbi:ATP-binding protein [Pluralibacter gergoviae]|uniref:ATP-binding protein n=1 Tax=Pluralibacter gergoviae TaxID=61647 RepID=A0AAI9DJ54_PLUGE|nr:AAA family ATPase [Pluralibacter gergoviae]EKV0914637.1 ATP-binding protein [Pluralibacter gergoviae]EKV9907433.1 ATP-binding protein [Pluralibacter gergoviae]EKW7272794.1 ATP-binding protein [Pluralibacter gergoviae]ELD4296031.1 ATP-binding protein [Pluralibacter gergoviae]ELD4306532.1 ATP-binding protein [Pluralibacter gergoviae]